MGHKWNGTPSRDDWIFDTELDANRFALQNAMRWIEENSKLQGLAPREGDVETGRARRDVGARRFGISQIAATGAAPVRSKRASSALGM